MKDPLVEAYRGKHKGRKVRGPKVSLSNNSSVPGDDPLVEAAQPKTPLLRIELNVPWWRAGILTSVALALLVFAGWQARQPVQGLARSAAEEARQADVLVRIKRAELMDAEAAPLTWGELFDLYDLPDARISPSVEKTEDLSGPVDPRAYRNAPLQKDVITLVF